MFVSGRSHGSKHSRCPKIYAGPENYCVSIPYSICSTRYKRWALAFPTKIFEIPGYSGRARQCRTNIVNPASFLSENMGNPVHDDCLETIEATYSSHLEREPYKEHWKLVHGWKQLFLSGKRHAECAITTSQEIIDSGPLPINTSTWKAKIIALTCALKLAEGKTVNIYTNSKYAFGVAHADGVIWEKNY